MVLSPLSPMAWFGLCHAPYSLLLASSDVLYKENRDTSSSPKQEMGRNILEMNLSLEFFHIFFQNLKIMIIKGM